MRSMGCRDQILWIENIIIAVDEIFTHHRVHVVDDDLVEDLVSFNTKITTIVPCNDVVSELTPFP